MMYKNAGKKTSKSTGKTAFKPCKGCPTPSKCKSMGKCAKKAKK